MAPGLSADGRFVAFASDARNLAPGDTNAGRDGFVRDLAAGSTARVSLTAAGAQAPGANPTNPLYAALSADGRVVAFESASSNFADSDDNGRYDVFVRFTETGRTVRVSVDAAGARSDDNSYAPALSADGRFVAFVSYATNLALGDVNRLPDLFVRMLP